MGQQQNCCGEHEVVKPTPERAPDLGSKVRRDHHKHKQVKRSRTGEVDVGLQRRLDRPQDVEEPKVRLVEKQQYHWMRKGERDGDVGGPLVEIEEADAAVGPALHGTVSQRDQHAEQEIDRSCSDGAEAEVGAEVQKADGQVQGNSAVKFRVWCEWNMFYNRRDAI